MPKSVIRCFKTLKRNTAKRAKLQSQISKLQARLATVAEDVSRGEMVSFIHDGVAVADFGDLRGLEGEAEKRSAHIYPNASDKRYWGLVLKYREGTKPSQEYWMGAGWKTYKICKFMALEWIVHGKMPLESLRRYHP